MVDEKVSPSFCSGCGALERSLFKLELEDFLKLYQRGNPQDMLDFVAKLLHGSTHDPLTGLLNRRGVSMVVDHVLAPTGGVRQLPHVDRRNFSVERRRFRHFFDRRSLYFPLCVVSIDIDKLHDINDLVGHARGDEVIKTTADLLKKSVRPSDLLARVGGDEFVVVLFDAHAAEVEAHILAISKALAEYDFHFADEEGNPIPLRVTFTWGIHQVNAADNLSEVIGVAMKHSDKHMMAKKRTREENCAQRA